MLFLNLNLVCDLNLNQCPEALCRCAQEDEQRVSQLFLEADTAGIAVQQRSLTSAELQEVASTGACLVIALVDKRKLDAALLLPPPPHAAAMAGPMGGGRGGAENAATGAGAATAAAAAAAGERVDGEEYTGHYVLIVGFDASTHEFLVRDPATPVSELRVSPAALDLARRSFGTDEDLLIVPCTVASAGGGEGGGAAEAGGGNSAAAVAAAAAAEESSGGSSAPSSETAAAAAAEAAAEGGSFSSSPMGWQRRHCSQASAVLGRLPL